MILHIVHIKNWRSFTIWCAQNDHKFLDCNGTYQDTNNIQQQQQLTERSFFAVSLNMKNNENNSEVCLPFTASFHLSLSLCAIRVFVCFFHIYFHLYFFCSDILFLHMYKFFAVNIVWNWFGCFMASFTNGKSYFIYFVRAWRVRRPKRVWYIDVSQNYFTGSTVTRWFCSSDHTI